MKYSAIIATAIFTLGTIAASHADTIYFGGSNFSSSNLNKELLTTGQFYEQKVPSINSETLTSLNLDLTFLNTLTGKDTMKVGVEVSNSSGTPGPQVGTFTVTAGQTAENLTVNFSPLLFKSMDVRLVALNSTPFGSGEYIKLNADGKSSYATYQSVPEPSTLGLMGLGAAGLLFFRARRS